jgi:hypothetical protein
MLFKGFLIFIISLIISNTSLNNNNGKSAECAHFYSIFAFGSVCPTKMVGIIRGFDLFFDFG